MEFQGHSDRNAPVSAIYKREIDASDSPLARMNGKKAEYFIRFFAMMIKFP